MRNKIVIQATDALKLRNVMEFYGVHFNSSGFAKCPFHNEKTASLSIKKEHYKCFGCGRYGGIIDFVMEQFGITFTQAIVRLDSDFNLGLIGKPPTRKEQEQARENRAIERAYQQWKAMLHSDYLTLCKVHQILYRRYLNGEPWLEKILTPLEELLDKFDHEEARAWKTAIM